MGDISDCNTSAVNFIFSELIVFPIKNLLVSNKYFGMAATPPMEK